MHKFPAFVVFFFLVAVLQAQDHDFALRNYTAVHGLPQSQVNTIVEDGNGYLWIGTTGGGLARFDGKEFRVFTTLNGLLSNTVFDIKIDKQQNLWIAHPRGITKFDGQTFKKFQAPGALANLRMVRRVHLFKDSVFVFSAPGVYGKIFNDSVHYWNRQYENDKFINRVHPVPTGELFFLLNDGQLVLKTSKGYAKVGTTPKGYKVYSMHNQGNSLIISFASREDSIKSYKLNSTTKKLEIYQTTVKPQVLTFDAMTNTYWLKQGNTLLTRHENDSGSKVILSDIDVSLVYPDKEGNVWIATNGNGLYRYFHQDFSRCSSENMRGVMSIFKANDNTTWIGTMNKGLWKIKQGKISSYIDKHESFRNMINCVAQAPDGTLWVGTSGGLAKYNPSTDSFTWFTPHEGLAGYSVLNISFDEKGHLWVGTGAGLNYFNGEEFKVYKTEQGLLSNTVNAAYYLKRLNTLYVGNEFGINTITNGKVGKLPIKGFENTTVITIQPYQDSLLLMGSGGAGFAVFNPKTQVANFVTTRDGLQSDFIYFIAADEKNYIWVGTEKGISKVYLNDKFEIVENLHFDHDNGLQGVETNQNAFYIGATEKYFGLIDGLYEFNEWKNDNHRSFELHLTALEVFYGEESSRIYADSLFGSFKLPYHPVFPHNKNHLTFSFNRVDKQYPKSVRFKYRLKNFDNNWSQPTANKQVTYSNLPPGEYEFQLMATDNKGSWSDVQLRYPLVVKAPFYMTASFIAISVVIVSGLIIFIFYWRVRQRVEKTLLMERIREQEQEHLRKEIARDFHDEMGNQLTRIINYVSLLRLNGSIHQNGNSSHNDLYVKVEDSAKYLYTGTRDFIWSIDPVNDELSKLFLHIRDFGEKLFEEKDIKFRAMNTVKGKVKLPYGFSRQANLIFKEVMTNAFKSSQAGNATFSLKRTGSSFEFAFHDDGIGFNVSAIEASNGLKNIRERAEKLNAVLYIKSEPGKGTTITLRFQLTKNKSHGTTI